MTRRHIENVDAESRRYEKAIAIAMQQLSQLYEKAVQDVGELNAQIFEVHKMMLEDGDYMDSVFNMIRSQKMNAEYAIATTGDNFSKMFSTMEDAYFQARAADVKDITERLLIILNGDKTSVASATEPMILVADDLAPSETIQMDKKNLLSFVTRQGSTSSHTAILARTLGIPAIIHVDFQMDWDGKLAIEDGYTGTVILEPDEEVLQNIRKKSDWKKRKKNCSFK